MRIALLATVAALGLSIAAPAFADDMSRDGGPSGASNGAQFSTLQRHWNEQSRLLQGRSVGHDQQISTNANDE